MPCQGRSAASQTGASLELVSAQEACARARIVLYKSPLALSLGFPGIAICIAIRLTGKRKAANSFISTWFLVSLFVLLCLYACAESPLSYLERGEEACKAGSFEKARSFFEKASTRGLLHSEHPLVRRNIAVCYLSEGKPSLALFELYGALRASPGEMLVKQAIKAVESKEGLDHQYVPAPSIDPDIPFASALILFNLFFIVLGIFLRTRKGAAIAIIALISVLFVTAAGFAGFSMNEAARQYAIVSASATGMKKIPLSDFREEKRLGFCTSLLVHGEANGYVLVQTGTGYKGWIRKEDLIVSKR